MAGDAGDPAGASCDDTGSDGAGSVSGHDAAELSDTGVSPVTATAMRTLRQLAGIAEPVPAGQLAGALGLSEREVRSLLERLVADGFAVRDGDGYRLGERIVELARRVEDY